MDRPIDAKKTIFHQDLPRLRITSQTRDTPNVSVSSDTDEYRASLFMMKPQEPLTDQVAFKPIIVHVTVNGKSIPFEIDSGATYTLISRYTFNQLSTGSGIPQLYYSNITLSTWGQTSVLKAIGKFHAQVSYNGTTAKLPVLAGEKNDPNLLGRNWFQPLRISIHGLNQLSAQNDAHGDDFAPTTWICRRSPEWGPAVTTALPFTWN